MLRNIKPEAGYHIFHGSSADGIERACADLVEKVKACEDEFEMQSLNFTLKYDEQKHALVHAIHAMFLTPKVPTVDLFTSLGMKPEEAADLGEPEQSEEEHSVEAQDEPAAEHNEEKDEK